MAFSKDAFFITYTDEISEIKVKHLIGVLSNILAQDKVSQFYFLFSSGGGNVNAGITLYNFLRAIPAEIIFHNIGTVDSIASCVFLAGSKRYASNHSHFLLHGVSFTITSAPFVFQGKQLQELLSTMQQNERDIASIFTTRTSLSEQEMIAIFDQGSSKGLDFALEKGVIHEVCDIVIPTGYRHVACVFN